MQCEQKKRDGSDCRARAVIGQRFCSLHSWPGRAAGLGRRGGSRRAIFAADRLKEFAHPKEAADLKDLLARSIIDIRAGALDPKVANSMAYLGACFLRATGVADIEERIEDLEQQARHDIVEI